MDLLEIVIQPTWREFLMELVQSEKMDPWDIDLSQVADKYLERIRSLASLELRVPANVILASSILLRMKADALVWRADEPEDYLVDEPLLLQESLPELVFKPNRPRARRVTLNELMGAMEKVLKEGRKIQRIIPMPISLTMQLSPRTMGERIGDVFEKAKALKDADNLVLFSELSDGNAVEHFIPVLHLVNTQKVDAWQDEVFGEIFLRVVSDSIGDAAEKAEAEEKTLQTKPEAN